MGIKCDGSGVVQESFLGKEGESSPVVDAAGAEEVGFEEAPDGMGVGELLATRSVHTRAQCGTRHTSRPSQTAHTEDAQ
jgi:hypothetical protein